MTSVLASLGLLGFGIVVVGALAAFVVIAGLRNRGTHDRILEWDPVGRVAWRWEQEAHDLTQMLELHNADRVRRGLEPITLNEYREEVRRRSAGG